jgi:hypothetical protein
LGTRNELHRRNGNQESEVGGSGRFRKPGIGVAGSIPGKQITQPPAAPVECQGMPLLRVRLFMATLGREDIDNTISIALALARELPRVRN